MLADFVNDEWAPQAAKKIDAVIREFNAEYEKQHWPMKFGDLALVHMEFSMSNVAWGGRDCQQIDEQLQLPTYCQYQFGMFRFEGQKADRSKYENYFELRLSPFSEHATRDVDPWEGEPCITISYKFKRPVPLPTKPQEAAEVLAASEDCILDFGCLRFPCCGADHLCVVGAHSQLPFIGLTGLHIANGCTGLLYAENQLNCKLHGT